MNVERNRKEVERLKAERRHYLVGFCFKAVVTFSSLGSLVYGITEKDFKITLVSLAVGTVGTTFARRSYERLSSVNKKLKDLLRE